MNKFARFVFFLFLFSAPFVASAHPVNILQGGFWGPIVSCGPPTGVPGAPSGPSPCVNLCDLMHTFLHLVYFFMSLTLYALAPVLFAWGGILIMIAGADPNKLSGGKKLLLGTLVGVLITLAAFLIIKTFVTALGVEGRFLGFTNPLQCLVQ